jgi:hypothetical protein
MNAAGESYLRLWDADGCIEMNQAYEIQEYIPNSLAIGDDGGCDALIYINIDNNTGLYIASFAVLEEWEYIASSLERFLVFGEGIETYKKWA